MEARWPHSKCAEIWIEQSKIKLWPGHCVVFFIKTLYSHMPLSTQVYK